MKKIMCTILAGLMTFSLMACGGSKPQSAVLLYEQDGVNIEYTIEAEGDIIQKITQVSSIDCSAYTEEQITLIEDSVEEFGAIYADIDGVEYSSEVVDSNIIETIVLDVTNEDSVQELSDQGLLPIEGDGTKLSFEKTLESLESQGWVLQGE